MFHDKLCELLVHTPQILPAGPYAATRADVMGIYYSLPLPQNIEAEVKGGMPWYSMVAIHFVMPVFCIADTPLSAVLDTIYLP